ncbi:ROK family protein [Rhodocytophaga aerolata]|uniref:ROK family protein n=1 Tax=Rhodocytophaga aerolata TaxID=455078 RepID=A0ABT8R2V0_9BACT|nr:ROK family protein [Rhodocytophaga aerolata]MDO1446435.1 ROK family protein [Rhodocytophaga aerolata]
MNKYYAGLDIGGSHISAGLIEVSDKQVVSQLSVHTQLINSGDKAELILEGWLKSIEVICRNNDIQSLDGIGFAMPGPFQYEKGIATIESLHKYDHLFGINCRATIAAYLNSQLAVQANQINFVNDAHGFLLGSVQANGWEKEKVLAITIGTGLGGGFFAEGQVVTEGQGVPKGGFLYYLPFKEGIAEDYISTRWLLNRFNSLKGSTLQNVKQLVDYYPSDALTYQVFYEFGTNLAEFLIPIIDSFEPTHIIFGGNIVKAYEYFKEPFQQTLKQTTYTCQIHMTEHTSQLAILGAVQPLIQKESKQLRNPHFRETLQPLLPLEKSPGSPQGYDIYPTFKLEPGSIHTGFESLANWIITQEKVIIDGYGGVLWEQFINNLNKQFFHKGIRVNWLCVDAAWKDEKEISQFVEPYLGADDPIFGKLYPGELSIFFDPERLKKLKPEMAGINILYGCGAALARWKAPLIYLDVPKNEIQFRSRAGNVCNIGALQPIKPGAQYKRFYFVDWVVLNKHKQQILPSIDVVVDEQRIEEITWMRGDDFRNAMQSMTHHMFRVRPWFEPGVWGGKWIKDRIEGLSKDVVNYAWSFELIVPENGIILESDRRLLEVSFDFLMYAGHDSVLGKAAKRFNYEFPIRFDFLDTIDGGNLSLQCHPTTKFIKEHFGENFTQDETYYILDAGEEAKVYLGFQENIDQVEFKAKLEDSFQNNTPVEVENYVQTFPAHKHDLFLIPSGTVHCSGKNTMVLEISATPYIYTFKMYDWLRLDLKGLPRPLNIDRAFQNLNFERKGEKVQEELLSRQEVIKQGTDWQLLSLSTHPEHFYAIHRIEFDSTVEIATEGHCHILSLVEGSTITVRTGTLEQTIHYAETFVVPAAAGTYFLINQGNSRAKVVKAFVKDDHC